MWNMVWGFYVYRWDWLQWERLAASQNLNVVVMRMRRRLIYIESGRLHAFMRVSWSCLLHSVRPRMMMVWDDCGRDSVFLHLNKVSPFRGPASCVSWKKKFVFVHHAYFTFTDLLVLSRDFDLVAKNLRRWIEWCSWSPYLPRATDDKKRIRRYIMHGS